MVQEGSFSPHPFEHLLFVDFFDDGHSDPCKMIPQCSFDFHVSNNEWCWASFHVFISHLYDVWQKPTQYVKWLSSIQNKFLKNDPHKKIFKKSLFKKSILWLYVLGKKVKYTWPANRLENWIFVKKIRQLQCKLLRATWRTLFRVFRDLDSGPNSAIDELCDCKGIHELLYFLVCLSRNKIIKYISR